MKKNLISIYKQLALRKIFLFSVLCNIFSTQLLGQSFTQQQSILGVNGMYGMDMFFGGGAISFADFNGDGLDDLTFGTESGADIIFFENKGDHFEKLEPAPINYTYETKQVLWVDYDNDGDKDFFATSIDGPNLLFRNNGNMDFTDVTVLMNLPTSVHMSQGANFGDINKDGYLDLYICNSDHQTNGFTNWMYIFDPSLGIYVDHTVASGTGNGVRQTFCSAFFDMDLDGDLDLYVINDHYTFENSMYMNQGNGTFIDVSVPSGTNVIMDSMNAGIGDYNNDGYLDIFITNNTQSVLYHNNGDMTFTDTASFANVLVDQWAWGANWIDFDNDRDQDLYVSTEYNVLPNPFYVNNNDGTFSEPMSNLGGITNNDIIQAFSNARGDFNNDGKMDLAMNPQYPENFRLYCNHEENENNFIKFSLQGTQSNRDAYGAMIELYADGIKTIEQTHSAIAYQCQNSDYIVMGLGTATSIDSLVIKWPYSDNKDVIYNDDIVVNGFHAIVENAGVVSAGPNPICINSHDVVISPIPSQTYGGSIITESSSRIGTGVNVVFQSEEEVILHPGFNVKMGASFLAEIKVCGN